MKKKYFTPEMEEVELDSPAVLQMEELSTCTEFVSGCPYESCGDYDPACPTEE